MIAANVVTSRRMQDVMQHDNSGVVAPATIDRRMLLSPSIDAELRTHVQQLLVAYGARVRKLIETYSLAKHGVDGADVEQQIRIRLWRAIDRESSASFNSSYIQRVVLSTVIDAIRSANEQHAEPSLP
jgi:DNA-directed RNA polymerase specialized sigma24 family protein